VRVHLDLLPFPTRRSSDLIERVLENKHLKVPALLSHVYVIFVLNISWVFFRSDTMADSFQYIATMFNFSLQTNMEFLNYYLTKELIFVLFAALILSTPIYKKVMYYTTHSTMTFTNYTLFSPLKSIGLFMLLIICFTYIATDSYNPFIYFRF